MEIQDALICAIDFGNVGAESSDYNYVGMGQTDGNSKHPTADVD